MRHSRPRLDSRSPRRITGIALAIALVAAAVPAGAGDVHRWRDSDGHVVFGDRPPPDAQATVVKVRPNVYESVSVERLAKEIAVQPQVVMYSAEWCGYCRAARDYFNVRRIAFSEYDVETTERGRADYARLGAHGVPVILVGEQRMNGFDAETFDRLYRRR